MNDKINNTSVYDTAIRLAFLAFIVAWCVMILSPFVTIILWSIILFMAFLPLHNSLVKLMGGKPRLAAIIIVFACLAIIIIPSWFFIDSIIKEVKSFSSGFLNGNFSIPPPSETVKSWPIIGNQVYDFWLSASQNLTATLAQYKDQIASIGSKVAQGILSAAAGIFQMMVSLLIAGVLLVVKGTADSIRKFFRKVSGDKGDEFADITHKTVVKVVKGVMGVALIQAVLIGVGFLLAGIPYAGIWSLIVFVLAVLQLPVILVVIPVSIYMFVDKDLLPAILWTIYLLLAGASENIFKPLLLGKGAPVPMLVIFIGVIGGFILSGFIGLFTGAIVLSLGYKLFQAWLDDAAVS